MNTLRRFKNRTRGFTLLEVVLAMTILALLAAAVYAVVAAAITASRETMEQQLVLRRTDAFVRLLREAMANLPGEGNISLEIGRSRGGAPEQRLVLTRAGGLFGLPSLAGGSLVLASKARSDGSRSIVMHRIPPKIAGPEREEFLAQPGIPLLPGVIKPQWSFFQGGVWREEWPQGSPRPELVRLTMEPPGQPGVMEVILQVPPVAVPTQTQQIPASPLPTPQPPASPTPTP